MKLAGVAVFFLLLMPAAAQPESTGGAESHGAPQHEQQGHTELWKWANFLLLAGVIGYYVGKHGGPFFDARSRQIRKDMVEAEEARKEAEAKVADVDRRLANLQAEIEALRAESQHEQAAEGERLRQQTAAEMTKIQHHAEQEIASAGKAARMELKRYCAQLALGLAEQKIRARMTPETQDGLVRGFVHDLDTPAAQGSR